MSKHFYDSGREREVISLDVEIERGASVDTLLKAIAWGGPDAPPMPNELPVQGHPINFALAALGHGDQDARQQLYQFLRIIYSASGIADFVMAAGFQENGTLSSDDGAVFSTVMRDLLTVLLKARSGDELAGYQLEAIQRVLNPHVWSISDEEIRGIAETDHTNYGGGSASLARGWEIRRIMGALSMVTMPIKEDELMTPSTQIKLKAGGVSVWGLYAVEYEEARRQFNRQQKAPTLRTLAIRVYLERLEQESITTLSEDKLGRDLRAVEEWDRQNGIGPDFKSSGKIPPGVVWVPVGGGPNLPVRTVAPGWKDRYRKDG